MAPAEADGVEADGAVRATARVLGRRNLAYLAFTLVMVPLGVLLDAGPQAAHGPGGGVVPLVLWLMVSMVFVPVNGLLLLSGLLSARDGARIPQALLACALPFVVGIMVFAAIA